MGICRAFWQQQTVRNSARFSYPTCEVGHAKHYCVPLCGSYEPEASILLVAADTFYSADKRPMGIREVRNEECLDTLLVWIQDNGAASWEHTRSRGHGLVPTSPGKLTGRTQRSLPKGWALTMSPSGEDTSILALGRGVKVVPLLMDAGSVESQMHVRNGI